MLDYNKLDVEFSKELNKWSYIKLTLWILFDKLRMLM
jgi:hypothetical protein